MKIAIVNVIVTFVEGFLAAWAVTGNTTNKEALVGAVAAGASIAYNAAIKPLLRSKGVKI